MARAPSLFMRLAAAWAVLLALGAALDLHFAVETGPTAHGVFDAIHGLASSEEVFVAVEPCTQQNTRHVEEAEKRLLRACPLCLRNLKNRALETTSVPRVVAVSASETRFLDRGRAPAARPYSPKSVRGPPIT